MRETLDNRPSTGKSIDSHRYHFPSVSTFRDGISEWERHPADGYSSSASVSQINSGKKLLTTGDVSTVAQAQTMIDRFNEEIPSLRRVWTPAVAGFFPNVPAFLAGEPESMWRMDDDSSDRAPIRVWVGVMSSGGISDEELIRRGAALAAFGMALSERRPVLITPYYAMGDASGGRNGTKGTLVSWDLQSSPIVLSEVMACIAHPDVIRYLGWYVCGNLLGVSTGCWYPDFLDEKWMRRALGCADDDIWLPSAMYGDQLINRPIEWIKQEITKHISDEGE